MKHPKVHEKQPEMGNLKALHIPQKSCRECVSDDGCHCCVVVEVVAVNCCLRFVKLICEKHSLSIRHVDRL
jgi:hypothetical protein